MAFDLVFNNPTCNIPKVKDLEREWANVPNPTVRTIVAREHQYLKLHGLLLMELRHTKDGRAGSPPYKSTLNYNLRAGFIKATLLVAASICEAVLRAHAEKRKYTLPKKKQRTFGVVLNAWKGKTDLAHLYGDLEALKDIRNNIHLFVAASSATGDYKQVLKQEKAMLSDARRLIDELKKLRSP